jgi:threonine dehydrogenase-like Zn-dependent dehydrogenase
VDEITLIGSRCGPFPPALQVISQEQVDVKYLIQSHYPLDEAIAAFDRAQERGVLKVLLEIGAESF